MNRSHSLPLTLPVDHLGLYVHVPFCVRKCRYCDFASQALCADPTLPDRYLDALAREADQRRAEMTRPLHSVFIGGGTPTTLTGAQLRRLWQDIIAPFTMMSDVEISLEANPGTLTDDVLAALAEMPLSRVSLGVQSVHADELAMLGRIHTAEDVAAAVTALRAIGVPQINLDLMYAIPGQTPERWEATLRQTLALQPDHLSCYSLIVEEGTPLAAQVAAGICVLPGEEDEEAMLEITDAMLAATDFTRYEVSNMSRPGAVSRHNLGYWLGRDYLGIGPAATSTMDGLRWRNIDDAANYAARGCEDRPVTGYLERLSAVERLLERVMLGLRLKDGFDLHEAEAACGVTLRDIAGDAVTALQAEDFLELEDGILRLTPKGYPLANVVVTRLMAASDARTAT